MPLISSALPGRAGRLRKAAFGRLSETFRSRIRAAGELDACLLSIAGSMAADGEDLDDAEGRLLIAVRDSLPAGAHLGVALDMHANVTQRMLDAASVMLAYQTFPPHWDKREVGARIADLIVRAVRGEIRPLMAAGVFPSTSQPDAANACVRSRRAWGYNAPDAWARDAARSAIAKRRRPPGRRAR